MLEMEGSEASSTYQWKQRCETMLGVVHTDEKVQMLVEKDEAVDRFNTERQVHQEKEGRKLGLVLASQFQVAV